MVAPFGKGENRLMISVMSLLPLENVLCGLCELSLPLSDLLSGQLGRGEK
jgi:hypothetical protein